jgi:RNA exonuclease 4
MAVSKKSESIIGDSAANPTKLKRESPAINLNTFIATAAALSYHHCRRTIYSKQFDHIMCHPQAIKKSKLPTELPSTPRKPNKKCQRNKEHTNRRRRRPSISSIESSCTLSTVPSYESLDCSIDITHSPQRQQISSRRRAPRKNKSKPSQAPKQVQITELTDEEKSRYIALDAEMVGVIDKYGKEHSALARISLVDWNGESIFDSYVKVTQPIVDYRTFVSGITPSDLGEDALPILEVRRIVGELIHDKIVIGHGLKNDFKALGLSHPWHLIRDSAKYQPFMKAPSKNSPIKEYTAKKLKILALDKLGMCIQREGEAHDPNEDAVAALELYKKHREKWEKVVEWKVERSRGILLQNDSLRCEMIEDVHL